MRISIEINDVHLAALDALAERYAVGRDEMIAPACDGSVDTRGASGGDPCRCSRR